MTVLEMTPEELKTAALRAVERELGPVGLVRFLQLIEKGEGDFTEERREWLDSVDLAAIARDIEQLQGGPLQ